MASFRGLNSAHTRRKKDSFPPLSLSFFLTSTKLSFKKLSFFAKEFNFRYYSRARIRYHGVNCKYWIFCVCVCVNVVFACYHCTRTSQCVHLSFFSPPPTCHHLPLAVKYTYVPDIFLSLLSPPFPFKRD